MTVDAELRRTSVDGRGSAISSADSFASASQIKPSSSDYRFSSSQEELINSNNKISKTGAFYSDKTFATKSDKNERSWIFRPNVDSTQSVFEQSRDRLGTQYDAPFCVIGSVIGSVIVAIAAAAMILIWSIWRHSYSIVRFAMSIALILLSSPVIALIILSTFSYIVDVALVQHDLSMNPRCSKRDIGKNRRKQPLQLQHDDPFAPKKFSELAGRPPLTGAEFFRDLGFANFSRESTWLAYAEKLKEESNLQEVRQKFALQYRLIGSEVNKLLPLIKKEFVLSWFNDVTDQPSFPNSIETVMRYCIMQISERLDNISFVNKLVLNILPVITKHITAFEEAQEHINDLISHAEALTDSLELDSATAKLYNGGVLHSAIDLDRPESNARRLEYFRKKLSQILPLVLPPGEAQAKVVLVLVREIMTNCILEPCFQLMTDPDCWNSLIVNYGESTIRNKNKIKKLKTVLQQQEQKNAAIMHKASIKKLLPSDSDEIFQTYLENIRRCSKLSEAKRIRAEVSIQISIQKQRRFQQGSASGQSERESFKHIELHLYEQRLLQAKKTVDEIISKLALTRPDQNVDLNKTFSASTGVLSATRNPPSNIQRLTLESFLTNSILLPYFMEFMERRSRTLLLQFWLVVEGLREPLDLLEIDDDDMNLVTQQEDLIDLQSTQDPLQTTSQSASDLTKTSLGDIDDVVYIVETYFSLEILDLPSEMRREMRQVLNSAPINKSLCRRARRILYSAQEQVYEKLAKTDFEQFKGSEIYLRLIAMNSQQNLSRGDSAADAPSQKANSVRTSSADSHNSDSSPQRLLIGSPRSSFSNVRERPTTNGSGTSKERLETKFLDQDNIDKLDEAIQDLEKERDLNERLLERAELLNEKELIETLSDKKFDILHDLNSRKLKINQLQRMRLSMDLCGRTQVYLTPTIDIDERGHDFVAYIIYVHVEDKQHSPASTWIVSRRYSEFYELHSYFLDVYQEVRNLRFPKKNALLRKQKSFVEDRRISLQNYLRALLHDREICSDELFRGFLACKTENASRSPKGTPRSPDVRASDKSPASMCNQDKMSFMENPRSDFEPSSDFVKRIVDFVMAASEFDKEYAWLNPKTILMILQQTLGGTIEKRVKEILKDNFINEQKIAQMISQVRESLWTNGVFRGSAQQKSSVEKSSTAAEAAILLSAIVPSYLPSTSASKLFRIVQNPILNAHLTLEIADKLIEMLFPEL